MNEVQVLENQIKKYAQAYYSGQSIVSDGYFDKLVDRLRELSPESEILKKTGWGFEPTESKGKKKVRHLYGLQVGSLNKVHSLKEVIDTTNLTKNPDSFIRISAKLDGLSVVTYYEKGDLVLALTRGTNNVGIDVTDKIKAIDLNIHKLPTGFTGAVRGEVVMPQEIWDTNPKYIKLREENASANPRNFAAGVMNRDEVSEDLKDLFYVTYKVLHSESAIQPSISDQYDINVINNFLEMNGFIVAPSDVVRVQDLLDDINDEELENVCDSFKELYPCDGLVLSVLKEDFKYDEIAYKFEAEAKEVTVKEITWNATRTGRIVPLVWFDPVELSGAMVTKATAFNAQFIKDNKINVGTRLTVCRSGEVIPDIQEIIKPSEEAGLIDKCPRCGEKLQWKDTDLCCPNENESQLAHHFISNIAVIDGVGYSLYTKFEELFNLSDLDSLVLFANRIKEEYDTLLQIIDNEVSGVVTIAKCKKILELLSGEIDPVSFLLGCNIKGLGEANIKSLFKGYPHVLIDIRDEGYIDANQFSECKGIGEALYNSMVDNIKRIESLLLAYDVRYIIDQVPEVETQFKVAITGSLSMKRADFDKLLSDKGIEQSGNFKNGDVKFLITNNLNSTSSKMKQAIQYGTEIISEEEFTKLYLN